MAKLSEITADGTYLVSERDGKPYPVELHTGYMVGVGSLDQNGDCPTDSLFGRWTNTDEVVMGDSGYEHADVVYWDRVECIDDRTEALALAEMYGELAIWDNAAGAEIRVDALVSN